MTAPKPNAPSHGSRGLPPRPARTFALGLAAAALGLVSACTDARHGTRDLPENDRSGAGTGDAASGRSSGEAGGDSTGGASDGNRYEDTDGNDVWAAGCLGLYDCETDGFERAYPDVCVSDTHLREAFTVGDDPDARGGCGPGPDVEYVDCDARCKEAGKSMGACVPESFDCFGEAVTSGACVCDTHSFRDSDGYDPKVSGCIAEATFGTCASVEDDAPKGDRCNGPSLEERIVEGGASDACGADTDVVLEDCDAWCDEGGTCVEESVQCLGAEITSARCACIDPWLPVKDSDEYDDPLTAGCVGEHETCDGAQAIGAVPDACEDELVLREQIALDDACGERGEVSINCGMACRDAGQGWGRCGALIGGGAQVECFGLTVMADACVCDGAPRWYRDLEFGHAPDVPGLTEMSIANAANCNGALAGPYDYCVPDAFEELLVEVWPVEATEDSDACGPFECCEGIRQQLVDCDAWCQGQGRGAGTCDKSGMPHPDADHIVQAGYCACELDDDGTTTTDSAGGSTTWL